MPLLLVKKLKSAARMPHIALAKPKAQLVPIFEKIFVVSSKTGYNSRAAMRWRSRSRDPARSLTTATMAMEAHNGPDSPSPVKS